MTSADQLPECLDMGVAGFMHASERALPLYLLLCAAYLCC